MVNKDEINRLLELGGFQEGKPYFNSFFGSKGLEKNNHFILSKYFGPFSHEINRVLRSGDKINDFFILYEYLLNKTLRELPNNWGGTVFRMDKPGIEFSILKVWFQDRIGHVISFPNFLSTSKERWPEEAIIFKITTKYKGGGRDVTKFSNNLNENEVLFRSRTKFRIVSVNEKEKYIGLKEVKRDYLYSIKLNESIYINDPKIRNLLKLDSPNDLNIRLSLSDLGLI